MYCLMIVCLAYLSCAQPTSSADLFLEIKQLVNAGRHERQEQGCTSPGESTSCTLQAGDKRQHVESRHSILPHNTECLIDNGCYTCKEGSWVTSSCPVAVHHLDKRLAPLAIVSTVIGIITVLFGLVKEGFESYCKYFCKGDDGSKYKPPKFTKCEGPESVFHTKKHQAKAVVTWEKPKYKDGNAGDANLILVSTEGSSGSSFGAGSHTITYHLVDNQGYIVSCSFSFSVKVRRCSWPGSLRNGQINCGGGDILFGDQCHATCYQGYELDGKSSLTCTENKQFDANMPTCKPKQCRKLDNVSCTDSLNFNSVCYLTCDSAKGFSSFPRETYCEETGKWHNPIPECKDTQKPKFKGCGKEIKAIADSGKTTTVVTWKQPKASDNSGNVTVDQTDGLKSGNIFAEGSHIIKYTATDPSGHTEHCTFAIIVNVLTCGVPDFKDENLYFDCGDGFRYGASCKVNCHGLPLNGSDIINCTKSNTISPSAYWNHGGEYEPYCVKRPCKDLIPPKNGALACDTNMAGSHCSMSCQENWDIPRGSTAVHLYICGWITGKWSPTSDVPDCIVKRRAGKMRLKSELYYYSGSCGDSSTLEQIKNNFKVVVNDRGVWNNSCSDCTVENVVVYCGNVTSDRKSRSVSVYPKRSAEKRTVVSWDWVVPLDDDDTAVATADDMLMSLADRMHSYIQSTDSPIHMDGFELRSDSFGYDESHLDCPLGFSENWAKGTCSPCPTGTKYDKTNDDCVTCPIGFYQDEAGQLECKSCPAGTTTIITGARTKNNCTEVCAAGNVSGNGVVPCDVCPVGTYQPNPGATACLSCDVGTTTSNTASTSPDQCLDFDIRVEGPARISSPGALGSSTGDFTFTSWFTSGAEASLWIKQADGSYPFRLHTGQKPSLTLFGTKMTAFDLPASNWLHLSIVFTRSNRTMVMYVKNDMVLSRTLRTVPTQAISADSQLELNVQKDNVLSLRSLFVIPTALSAADVRRLSGSCGSRPSEFVLSLTDLTEDASQQQSVHVVMPSTCDAVDECEQSSPCNGHTCVNLPGSYRCECQDGYSGSDCSVPPDFCADNKCQHGKCENRTDDYRCTCDVGYKGQFCEEQIVNGGWGNWSEWNQCSLTCGGGIQIRRRRCDTPAPTRPEGKKCTGSDSETRACNTKKCPECIESDVRSGIGSYPSCTGNASALDCGPVCRDPSHVIDIQENLVVSCRNGEWNSKRPKVASCTKMTSPTVLKLTSERTLNTTSCLSQRAMNDLKSSIASRVGGIQCGGDVSCQATVNIADAGCSSGHRMRRSLGTTVTITLESPLPDGDLQLAEFITSKKVSPQLQKLVDATMVLETSAQQLHNDSSMFDVAVDGTRYSAVRGSEAVTPGAVCPPGTVVRSMLCVYCSPGTYNEDGKCKFCEVGLYQDEQGKSECKKCPPGKSTAFMGSTDVDDCTVIHLTSVADNDQDESIEQNDHIIGVAIGVAVACVVVVVVVATVIYIKYYRKRRQLEIKSPEHNSLLDIRHDNPATFSKSDPGSEHHLMSATSDEVTST